MRDRTSSFAMSAIVVGTYVCALYGAFGTPVNARPPLPARPAAAVAASQPTPTHQTIATVIDLADVR